MCIDFMLLFAEVKVYVEGLYMSVGGSKTQGVYHRSEGSRCSKS